MPTKKTISLKPSAISNFLLKGLPIAYYLMPIATNAQCAMCRASLESEGNKTKVEAVNDGIVLLMAVPYIIAAVVGYAIYRMYKKSAVKKA